MEISKKIIDILSKTGINPELIKLDHPKDEQFGDYSTNIAMILAKTENKNPNEIANDIKNKIVENEMLEKIEVVGGYINFYLKKELLKEAAEKLNYEIEFKNEIAEVGKGKTVVIDYSAPNIAKPFGIGHLRSTNIGQSLYNIYKILGWNCIGDNHLGDWGTQFGKLMVAIKTWWTKDLTELTIEELEKLYVKFHSEAKLDPILIDKGRDWFEKLEKGDDEAKKLWQLCVDISMREFDRVYELLGVKIDFTLGESFYQDKMKVVVDEMKKNKLLISSQGAEIVEFDDMPPAMVTKSNETTTYFTRDLATIKYRVDIWNPDLMIYEVGSDQILHFKQLFATAKKMGYEQKMVHIGHGLIRWATGKFSTRNGDTIHLEDVLNSARDRARLLAQNNSEEEIDAVAIGAIKFNDLSQDPTKDIIFDLDKVMSMEGNSGPYLQYTYARCQSVLNKTEIKEQKNIEKIPANINDEELALLRDFYKYQEKIIEAAERFNPAVIAEYLLTVARKYNEFYAKHRIINEPEETWRIFLTKTTSSVIKSGLTLLGIKILEKM